jgi:tryptophan-rich sensory protein
MTSPASLCFSEVKPRRSLRVQQYQLMAGTHRLADRRSMIPMPNNGLQRQPSWLFAPAWTLLYVLMGVAAWLVWLERGFRQARSTLSLFLIQLAVNALWTWLLFVWHLGALAFGEILILCTVVAFWRVRPMAGALLIPYLAWVTFASALTYAVWQHNPELLA